jgi:hypothetical protein
MFPSSGEERETPSLLDQTQSVSPSPHLKTEGDSVFETLSFLVFRIPDDDKIQKLSRDHCDIVSRYVLF